MNQGKILVTAIVVVLLVIGAFVNIQAAVLVGCVSCVIVFGTRAIVTSNDPYDEKGNYIREGDRTMLNISIIVVVLILSALIAGVALIRG